jgi:ABC-2 type transport system ATP-binding protein
MLIVDHVHKSFGGVHAVRGVTFELGSREIVGLLGPNGAGKTTTIRMITGFLAPDEGRVSVCGHDMSDSPAAAKRMIGYLPESAPMYPEMKVREYLDYRGRLQGMARRERNKEIERCLDRCRASDMVDRRIGALSKGYRQRVGLAASILHDPKVLVLDEPTNGLDPTQIHETRGLIGELAQERTLLLCSHILPEIERLCPRVIIIAGGQVRADGTIAALTQESAPPIFRLEVKLQGDPGRDAVGDAIRHAAPGSRVTRLDETGARWRIEATTGAEVREAIGAALTTLRLPVLEFTRERTTLEGVFMRATETTGAGAS